MIELTLAADLWNTRPNIRSQQLWNIGSATNMHPVEKFGTPMGCNASSGDKIASCNSMKKH